MSDLRRCLSCSSPGADVYHRPGPDGRCPACGGTLGEPYTRPQGAIEVPIGQAPVVLDLSSARKIGGYPLRGAPPKTSRTPEYAGPWRAWSVPIPPECTTQIAGWLLDTPGAHSFWRCHYLSVITLADLPGVPPAHRDYPEAEFEFAVYALNPGNADGAGDATGDAIDPDDAVSCSRAILRGSYVRVHVHGCTVDGVRTIAESLAREVAHGKLSPDIDWQREWTRIVKAGAAHYAGEHGPIQ